LFNTEPVKGNIPISEFAKNMPRDDGELIISYYEGTGGDLEEFGDAVYKHGITKAPEPTYMYGSY